jgi:hypothetical protein
MKGAARHSEVCPFIPGEDASERHERRMMTALEMDAIVHADLAERDPDLVLKICSPGHWQIRDGKKIVAQWWPQSGRFVPGEQYHKARKCHDVHQMLAALGKVLAEI